jgi:transitional endoplasmic reticulum ATPase
MEARTPDETTKAWFQHSNASRVSTTSVIATALKKQHPGLALTITSERSSEILSFAAAGHATYSDIHDNGGDLPGQLQQTNYLPPATRIDESPGALAMNVIFGKYLYVWEGTEFIVYLIEGATGTDRFSVVTNFFILSSDVTKNEGLLMAAGRWANELHEEIWVFDSGYWQKSAELYSSIMKTSWDAVILDPAMKKALIDDHSTFFASKSTYADLKVPWKRGLIYYGPPGNGKTISIKATMKMLYEMKNPVPTLYVRTLASVSYSTAARNS